jgi:hypothetical protein
LPRRWARLAFAELVGAARRLAQRAACSRRRGPRRWRCCRLRRRAAGPRAARAVLLGAFVSFRRCCWSRSQFSVHHAAPVPGLPGFFILPIAVAGIVRR